MAPSNMRAALWFTGLVLLTSWMTAGWMKLPPEERRLFARTPFPDYVGKQERHWDFLQEARAVLPDDAHYTIRASTTDEEMELFMLTPTILDGRRGTPSSYFGQTVDDAASARWILSFECVAVPPGSRVVKTLSDGCICERIE